MRLFPLVAVSLALVLAGCAKNDEPPPASSSSTPPTTSTPTSSPTTSTPTTSTPPVTSTPTVQPMTVTGTADWTSNPGPPPGPPVAKSYSVPAGYTKANLTVKWACASGAPACATSGVAVKAQGLTCSLADGPQTTPIANCVKEGTATVGDGKVVFEGSGLITATYTLTLT